MVAFSLDGDGSETIGGIGDNSDAIGAVGFDAGTGTDGGDYDANGTEFDPSIHIGRNKLNSDGSYRKKRQRRNGGSGPASGSRGAQTKANHTASVEFLGNTLLIVHAGLASFTKVKELEIDTDESQTLAKAVDNVLQHFEVAPDPKIQALIGLIVVAAGIYGPRFYLYNERVKSEKKKPVPLHVVQPGGAPFSFNPENVNPA